MPYTTAPVSIYYEVHGQSGSPLLMIMGHGGSIADWPPEQIERLSRKHQVIIFDNRGVGQSDKPTTAYTMADFAADTVGVLDALHCQKAHVFGVSMGGMIAQQVALTYPVRVSSLILGCTAPTGNPAHPKVVAPAPEVFAELMRTKSGHRAQDMEVSFRLVFTARFIAGNRASLNRFRDRLLAHPACPPETEQLQSAAAMNHDTYDLLGTIPQPTLILTGTEDMLVPAENSRIMARLIPGARLIEYANCAHGFLEESEGQAGEDILAFLNEVDSTM